MTLISTTLETAISTRLEPAIKNLVASNPGGDAGLAHFAKEFSAQIAKIVAEEIDTYLKSSTITVTGSSATGGPVTGVGIIS